MAHRMPALFLGHGSPMNAIERNAMHQSWIDLGNWLPRPSAILCVSAHWQTRGTAVSSAAKPETIHDFYGFPKALFDVRYPAPGAPELARRVADLLAPMPVALDPNQGLDHGAWGVLVALFPNADVPVLQFSLDATADGATHYDIGRKLAALREEGVLLLGSGNIVHNLRLRSPHDPAPPDWALRFDTAVQRCIEAGDHAPLLHLEGMGPDAAKAAPTPEHFQPLLYVLGSAQPGESARVFNAAYASTISMTSVLIGA